MLLCEERIYKVKALARLDGLAGALWAVYHTTSFDSAVARAVNLNGDADSFGSIAGLCEKMTGMYI